MEEKKKGLLDAILKKGQASKKPEEKKKSKEFFKKKDKRSLAEKINFGGKYRKTDS